MNLIKYIKSIMITFIGYNITTNVSRAEILNEKSQFRKGDIISLQKENGSWRVVKILEIDEGPDNTLTAHCLTYKPVNKKPELADIENLEIFIFHAPIDAASFSTGWQLVANSMPHENELVGFVEYLKLTDFQRYAEVTNQEIDDLIFEANKNYQLAIEAGEKGNHKEAIALYSKAIDLFPLFYEAIDNQAFIYMDIGKYEKAINNFQHSLEVNPNGLTAFFSMGECLLKLGKYDEAMNIFKGGLVKFPDERSLFKEFYNKAKALRKNR